MWKLFLDLVLKIYLFIFASGCLRPRILGKGRHIGKRIRIIIIIIIIINPRIGVINLNC